MFLKHNAEALRIICCIDSEQMSVLNMKNVGKLSSHFEYLNNWLPGLDIVELTVQPRTVLSRGVVSWH